MRFTYGRRAAGLAIAAVVCSLFPMSTGALAGPTRLAARGGTESPIELEPVATNLARPVYLTHAGDGTGRLFVVEKVGRIRIVDNGDLRATPFLDISSKVESGGNEQGLLSVAFHPDYASNGKFYVYYVTKAVGDVEDGTLTISQFQVMSNDPNRASTTETVLLRIPHPGQSNHNGGLLKFGPDGFLYAGIGDGGGAGDPGAPPGNGQNTNVLLGKILRLDVDTGSPYGIPADNPFADGANGKPEIFAYGFRNPWRWSFDRQTGKLWVGDVGQNLYEEVDIVTLGGDYGWNKMEGFHCFNPSTGCDQTGLTLPIFEYSHEGSNGVGQSCSITGGYVYRGSAIPSLRGKYVFADYCVGAGELFAITQGQTTATSLTTGVSAQVNSFGEDQDGELYVITDGTNNGAVYKIVRANGGCDVGCPDNVSVEDADGDGAEDVTFDAPTTSGDCGTVTCAPASGSSFEVGTTTVTCTSSAAGAASCSFTVTVTAEGGLSLTGVDPASAARKSTLTVTLTGSGFVDGTTVSFGKKIKVSSVTVNSSTELSAEIKVKKAKRGARDVTVTTPNGGTATCTGCFTVN